MPAAVSSLLHLIFDEMPNPVSSLAFSLVVLLLVSSVPAALASTCNYSSQACGGLPIPYPFGMSSDCGLSDFRISCKRSSSIGPGYYPFLQIGTPATPELQVLNFSTDYIIVNSTYLKAMPTRKNCNLKDAKMKFGLPDDGPFVLSQSNFFAVIGCTSKGSCTALVDSNNIYELHCTSGCYNEFGLPFCNAYACCIATLPPGTRSLNFTGNGISYLDFPDLCGFSTVLDPDTFISTGGAIGAGIYGLSISWGITFTGQSQNCTSMKTSKDYLCAANSQCVDVENNVNGYACSCIKGYHGDGYKNGLGCEDVDECLSQEDNNCELPPEGKCTNTAGSFNCSCNPGYKGDGYKTGHGCEDIDECLSSEDNNCEPPPLGICTNTPGSFYCNCTNGGGTGLPGTCKGGVNVVVLAVSVGAGAALVMLVLVLLLVGAQRTRNARRRREENFRRNGGEGLLQQVSTLGSEDSGRRRLYAPLFTPDELQRATQNFSEDNRLGSGAFGTVYKGKLANSGRLVAIKKAKNMEQDAVGQFINEIILLGQVDHPNIVHLLGCCLHTEVPLLVYEYIDNGTLLERLQKVRSGAKQLSWEMRLHIAVQSAEALAHLHQISPPILHRDIKSANILLDQLCTPKIADFGASHFLPSGHTHLSVDMLVFTMGYLDPEYFLESKFTDKSDVYSFGVVLLELITAQPAFSGTPLVQRYFVSLESGEFEDLIDRSLVTGGGKHVMASIRQVADVAKRCLAPEGRRRPTMREVRQDLGKIHAKFRAAGGSKELTTTEVMHRDGRTHEDTEETSLLMLGDRRQEHKDSCYTSSSSLTSNSAGSLELISFSSTSQ